LKEKEKVFERWRFIRRVIVVVQHRTRILHR